MEVCLSQFFLQGVLDRGIRCLPIFSFFVWKFLGTLLKINVGLNPVTASRGGPAMSHLFFADDLILFAKVDEKNCQSIREVLEVFGELSTQKVSASKSKVFFSPNVPGDTRSSLADILCFHSTPNLGKYLGFPLKHVRSSSQDYNFIIEKVQRKLAGWKSSLLSFTGRVVLA